MTEPHNIGCHAEYLKDKADIRKAYRCE